MLRRVKKIYSPDSPYLWGRADAKGGLPHQDNPYPEGTAEFQEWMEGWSIGQLERSNIL